MSILAKSPSGVMWWLYASSEIPDLTSIRNPPPNLIRDTIYESPTFLSTNRTIARQWIVDEAGTFSLKTVPVNQGAEEYIEFLSPAGVRWVCGLNDDGSLYTELFTSSVPKSRRVVSTVMHKGKHVYVADNRFPIPLPRSR